MQLKGSKTEENLVAAFAGESMAAMRYGFFAQHAKQEGYEQIEGYFNETAVNERAHAKQIFKFLGDLGGTKENLKQGATGEHEEWAEIYKEMEQVARTEGFVEIAAFFQMLSKVEKAHEERFLKLHGWMEQNEVFTSKTEVKWQCRNCGHVHEGKQAPEVCPLCKHPKAFFERKDVQV